MLAAPAGSNVADRLALGLGQSCEECFAERGTTMSVEQVTASDEVLAIIVRHDFSEPGVHFFTPGEFSQQLGYMQHAAGKLIQPHVHSPVPREVEYTQEVLFIKKGRLRVDFYDRERRYLESSHPRGRRCHPAGMRGPRF